MPAFKHTPIYCTNKYKFENFDNLLRKRGDVKKIFMLFAIVLCSCSPTLKPDYEIEEIIFDIDQCRALDTQIVMTSLTYVSENSLMVNGREEAMGGLQIFIRLTGIEQLSVTISQIKWHGNSKVETINVEQSLKISFPDNNNQELIICKSGHWGWIEIPITTPTPTKTPVPTKTATPIPLRQPKPATTHTPVPTSKVSANEYTYYRCPKEVFDRWCVKIHYSLLKGKLSSYTATIFPVGSNGPRTGFDCSTLDNHLSCKSPEGWDFDAGEYRIDIQVIEIRLDGKVIYTNTFSRLVE